MHIALCDGNAADRKQFERLMGREIDKWIKREEPVYFYSFGSLNAMFLNAVEMSCLFLDVAAFTGETIESAIEKIRAKGFRSIICVCSEEEYQDVCEDIRYIKKPVRPEDISLVLEYVKDHNPIDASKIEIRDDKETYYLSDDEILYILKKGNCSEVHTLDGKAILYRRDINDLYMEISVLHECFVPASNDAIINKKMVKDVHHLKAVMCDSFEIKLSLKGKKFLERGEKGGRK